MAAQALPQRFAAAIEHRHAARFGKLLENRYIEGDVLRPAGEDYRVAPLHILQQFQKAHQVSCAQAGSAAVDSRFHRAAHLNIDAALAAGQVQ